MNRPAGSAGHLVDNAVFFQQCGVSHQNFPAADHGPHAPARDFLCTQFVVRGQGQGTAGLPQRHGDGVSGLLLRRGRNAEQFLLTEPFGEDIRDGKPAFGDGACLVKNKGIRMGKGVKRTERLGKNAVLCHAPRTSVEGQRNRCQQLPGVGGHQQHHGPANIVHPLPVDHRGDNGQQQCGDQHCRCVKPGGPADTFFPTGFFPGSLIHQLQQPVHRGVFKAAVYPDTYAAGHIDTAGKHPVSCRHCHRLAFTCQGRDVYGADPFQNYPVQRDALSRVYHDNIADIYIFRCDFQNPFGGFHLCVVRPDTEQFLCFLSASRHSGVFRQLAQLQHHQQQYRFHEGAGSKGGNGGDKRQRFFMEEFLIAQPSYGFNHRVKANQKVRDEEADRPDPSCGGQHPDQHQHAGGQYRQGDILPADVLVTLGLALLWGLCRPGTGGTPTVHRGRCLLLAPIYLNILVSGMPAVIVDFSHVFSLLCVHDTDKDRFCQASSLFQA